jgi:hypothetical protein
MPTEAPLIAGGSDDSHLYKRFQGYLKDTLNQLSERRDEVTPTIDISRGVVGAELLCINL